MSRSDAEELFLNLYEFGASKAEYLQPDGHKQLIAETAILSVIVAAVSGAATALSTAFIARFGEHAADKTLEAIERAKSDPTETQILEVLTDLVPLLTDDANWSAIEHAIEVEFRKIGFSETLSKELALAACKRIQSKRQ